MARVAVVGPTTWGTTLAVHLASCGAQVWLLARTEAEAAALAAAGRNSRFLPDVPFPQDLAVTHPDTSGLALDGAEMLVIAVPSSSFRQNVRGLRRHLRPPTIVLSATKGLELETGRRMSQVLEEELPAALHERICVLSGPNLAHEIAAGKLATTVVASRSHNAAERAQELLMSPAFRVYTSEDVVGVELGGALKNIIAIGAGLADGLGYGDNGKAAFITRGLAEITRLGVAAGASPLTFAGLAGLGDLVA
ncbi:MAG: NAD(P)H-dependent glycerol-3-phosphate dehydrogenase, partial [Chloroflexota bacterium]|nr:NAD(P)H-dependent glycerol-3-phosphate dehydrogenase [Chloroflexota bacterium]